MDDEATGAGEPRVVGRRSVFGWIAGGAVAATGAAASLAASPSAAPTASVPSSVPSSSTAAPSAMPTEPGEAPIAADPADDTGAGADLVYAFEGAHQQGITTPLQAASVFVAFNATATDRAGLIGTFKALTAACRLLTAGGLPPDVGLAATSPDSGVLGPTIEPDGLTVTVSVSATLFDGRYGLAKVKPARLRTMTSFPNDSLDPASCGGDLLLQLCAHHADTVLHALRYLTRAVAADPDAGGLAIVWQQHGFTSPPRPSGTPRNLMGFKDGTANLDVTSEPTMDDLVWTHAGASRPFTGSDGYAVPSVIEPDWVEGGSYHVVRLIRMLVEFWDRVNNREQEFMIGRRKDTGAPLTGTNEFDPPNYVLDPSGGSIPTNAHIRLANPRLSTTEESRLLRRPYNYAGGFDVNGQQDMGLVFVAFNQDLDRQFVAVQTRLIDEPLVDYIAPYGGGYFFALPGVRDENDWLGRGMFDA